MYTYFLLKKYTFVILGVIALKCERKQCIEKNVNSLFYNVNKFNRVSNLTKYIYLLQRVSIQENVRELGIMKKM